MNGKMVALGLETFFCKKVSKQLWKEWNKYRTNGFFEGFKKIWSSVGRRNVIFHLNHKCWQAPNLIFYMKIVNVKTLTNNLKWPSQGAELLGTDATETPTLNL